MKQIMAPGSNKSDGDVQATMQPSTNIILFSKCKIERKAHSFLTHLFKSSL